MGFGLTNSYPSRQRGPQYEGYLGHRLSLAQYGSQVAKDFTSGEIVRERQIRYNICEI